MARQIGMHLEVSIYTDWSGSIRNISSMSLSDKLGHFSGIDDMIQTLAMVIHQREHRESFIGGILSKLKR